MDKAEKVKKVTLALMKRQNEARDKLNAPYERGLGKLAVRFSLLHSLLEQIAWDIWGMDPHVASVVTRDLPTKHLVTKLRSTINFLKRTEEDRKKFLSILAKVEKVAERRNEFLHSIWLIEEGKPVSCLTRKRGRLVGPDAPSSQDIEVLNSSIVDILLEFDAFRRQTS